MNDDMRLSVDNYIMRLRLAMRGASPDVVSEVEREIRAHIDDALAVRQAPSTADLGDVLERLGPPEDYGRDLALYMMVDRGYRHWSLPHMLRSTAFWAVSTVAGAVVVLTFGALYALAAAATAAALAILASRWGETAWASSPLAALGGLPAWLAVVGGPVSIIGLTLVVRWFVGQYVSYARPHVALAPASDQGWARRTERRILAIAGSGLLISLAAGLASGAYRFDEGFRPRLPPDYLGSPLAIVSALGLVLLILGPILGVAWSIHGDARRPPE